MKPERPGIRSTIRRVLSGERPEHRPRVSPTDIEGDRVLDRSGNFCEHTFEEETGYTTDEFVVGFLDEHGGGVRQQRLVGSLPWSESTVSRLLTELEDEGRIVRRRIGREKAVFLPGDVPEIAD